MGMIVSWMLVAAAIGAFAVTALSGCFVIPALHKLHFGQTIRESGPTWHNKKQGTPTMGGLCFIFGILVACGLVYAEDEAQAGVCRVLARCSGPFGQCAGARRRAGAVPGVWFRLYRFSG